MEKRLFCLMITITIFLFSFSSASPAEDANAQTENSITTTVETNNSAQEYSVLTDCNNFLNEYHWKSPSTRLVGTGIYWMVPDMVRTRALEKFKAKLNEKLSQTTDNVVTYSMIVDVIKEIVPAAQRQYVLDRIKKLQ